MNLKMNYSFYFYFYFLLKFFVNCQNCNGCKVVSNICTHENDYLKICNSKCRPNLASPNPTCVYCNNIQQGDKYFIDQTSLQCIIGGNIPDSNCRYIIFNSKQCVEERPSHMKLMGDFIYPDCNNGNRIPDGANKCKCIKFYIQIKDMNKNLCHCYNVDETACRPSDFRYIKETNRCYTEGSCSGTYKFTKYENREDKSNIVRCSKNCINAERIYKNTICVDDCPSDAPYYYVANGKKYCIDNCRNKDLYLDVQNKVCKDIGSCNYISDDNHCLSTCDFPYYKELISGINKCTLTCSSTNLYKSKLDNTCYKYCPSGFIQRNNYQCIDLGSQGNCFTDQNPNKNNKLCLLSCSELPSKPCFKTGTKKCIACVKNGYHKEGEYELFSNCDEAGLRQGSYYTKPNDYTCYCYLYAMDNNNKKVCYKDENDCKSTNKYKFRKGNECLEKCIPYFEVEDNVDETNYLKKCFNNVNECKGNYYYYYNTDMHKCWNVCPTGMYSNEVDKEGKPQEDITNSTCVLKCGHDFPKHTYGAFICKKECDSNEFYTLNDPNTCIASCNTTYSFIGENHECLKECDFNKYIAIVSIVINGVTKTQKRCVSNCASYGKFYITGNQNCFDNCLSAGSNYHFYNSDNRCLTSCLYNNKNEKFSYQFGTKPERCRKDNENKYYYEEDKIIRSSPCYLFSSEDPLKCIYNCDGRKVLPNNTCTLNCPSEYPYFQKEELTISPGNKININRCKSKCPDNKYVIIYSKECIDQCPNGFSQSGKICYPYCTHLQKFDLDDGTCKYQCNNYYEKTSYYGLPAIYFCRSACLGVNKYIKDTDDPECVNVCPRKNNFIQSNYECKPNCPNDDYYMKITDSPYILYQCLEFCPIEKGYIYVKYNGLKGECLQRCPQGFKYIIEGNLNECLSACPSNYYYNIDENSNAYIICRKYNFCASQNKYYLNGKCYDLNGCKSNKKYFVENHMCVDECKNKYKRKANISPMVECLDKCEYNEYIDTDDYCVTDCPRTKNFIGEDRYCKFQCDTNEDHYYQFKIITVSKNDKYTIYKCSKTCSDTTYYLEGYNTKECFSSCPSHLPFISNNEKKCYHNCLSSSGYKFTIDNNCVFSCNINKQYYYRSNQVCLNKCNNPDYAYPITENNYIYECIDNCNRLTGYYIDQKTSGSQKNFCVKKCPTERPYAEDNICKTTCSDKKKFFVKEFKHSGDNLQKICLTDCPKEYPYYTINKDTNLNECINTCDEGYKVINYSDTKINATLCIKDCPENSNSEYKFKIIDKNNKKCYSICPPEIKYHKFKYQEDNNCYDKCPEETPFTEKNQFECKSEEECDGKYIDYEKKECLPKELDVENECPTNKYKSLYKNKYICLDKCIEKYGKYLSPNGTCVNNCEADELVKGFGLINDQKNDKCICEHLYIINDALKMECLQNTVGKNKCKTVSDIYSIKMFNSKECVKSCNDGNILSASEDICYSKSHTCNNFPDDRNTKIITKLNGQKKCECIDKFYFKEDEEYPGTKYKKKVCLDHDGLCPSGYGKFIPETKECIETDKDCPEEFKYLFLGIFCLRDIPKNSTYNNTGKYYQCVKPNEYWHETTLGKGNYECLDKCLDKYPVYAPSTNQCLTTCKESLYPYFYENKCYNSCNNSKLLNIENGFITEITNQNSEESKYANYICDCHNPWFYNDVHKKICADSMIEYSITDCNNFTNPNTNPIYDHLVRKTLQCVDKCPKEFNYTFNFDCFENCTEAAFYYHYVTDKENSYECVCENLWFYEPNNKKQCIDPNVTECVVYDYEDKFFDKKYYDKKYLVNETNECVKECPTGSYSFNYVCYDKCPTYTQDNQNDHICKCNKYVGYWYEYERYNLTYLECAVEKCPNNNDNSTYIRENLLQNENKCLITCREDEDFPFSLRKVCVKECPYFTHTNDKEGELNDTCLFYDLGDEDVDTLEKFKGAANIQAMELYKNSEKTGGYLYDKFNTTLQIYAIDRNDSLKEISFKSNLTYIDFGTCLDKLMIDKNISENESILITKYDIMPDANINIPPDTSANFKNDKYLINPVEYELFSSLTNEKLDAFVCEPYEILISYPLCLSKFDKYINGINQNEYRKRFDIGKELYHKDNEIDTFNYNNSIYTHFCKELEINGKDLVFEDRYKYLYPNNKLLCESNCTLNNTDFELERVNCLCSYKNVFDFNRTEEEINDILNNPDFYLPTQSSTNAEIIKCLFNFTLKQAIIKNEMFYCCSIMTLAQIILVFITSFINIKNTINDIRHILNKVNIKNYFMKKNKVKINKYENDNIISSTNRELYNPPKKNNNNEDNDFNNTKLEKDLDSKINNTIILDKDKIYSSNNNKAEYIPPDYNFKYFKPKDKGVMKKIERNELPFEINPDTNYLIERREGIDYADDYLNGPYLKNQNILVIVNEKIHIENKNKNKSPKTNNNILSLNNANNSDNLNNDNLKEDKKENNSKIRNNKLYSNFLNANEKNFVSTKPIKSNLKPINNEKLEFNPEIELKLSDEGSGFFSSIRREQLYLRINYDKYLEKKNNNFYIVFLAEIFDKIYFIKICLFLQKFDIFNVHLSLYIFYHILLISLLCGFFTIKIIKKIWENDNFPDINFYLLYGLIANIVVWIIYQMFICLLDFNGKIKDMISLKYELIKNQYIEEFDKDNIHNSNEGIYKEKYDELIYQFKCRISIFYVIVFIFSLFFTIYLISFFSFYTGTKHRVLEAYYISIIEILLIKICYGLLLGSLRLLSKAKRNKAVYNLVYFFDKHIS